MLVETVPESNHFGTGDTDRVGDMGYARVPERTPG